MKLQTAQQIASAGQASGYGVKLMKRYSGRGMYGKETSALVADDLAAILQAVAVAAYDLRRDVSDAFEDFVADLEVCVDAMGRRVVVY
jgi:hypothetical protein